MRRGSMDFSLSGKRVLRKSDDEGPTVAVRVISPRIVTTQEGSAESTLTRTVTWDRAAAGPSMI